jgi:hypothetical protein
VTNQRTWTDAEVEYLKENYRFKENSVLANELNRTVSMIKNKLCTLSLKRSEKTKKETRYTNHSINWKTNINTPCCLLMPCSNCRELKPCTSFYIKGTRKEVKPGNGRKDILGNPRSSICRDCGSEIYMSHPIEKKLLYAATKRSNRDGNDCTITIEDIKVPKHCPVLGLELRQAIGAGRLGFLGNPNAPSLDRVDNTRGYVKDNICVISRKANVLKNQGDIKEFLAISAFIADYFMGNYSEEKECTPYYERGMEELLEILSEYDEYRKSGNTSVASNKSEVKD